MTYADNHFNTLRLVELAKQIQDYIDWHSNLYMLEAAIYQLECELAHIKHHIAEERSHQ